MYHLKNVAWFGDGEQGTEANQQQGISCSMTQASGLVGAIVLSKHQ